VPNKIAKMLMPAIQIRMNGINRIKKGYDN
jgi:hypothetical protein